MTAEEKLLDSFIVHNRKNCWEEEYQRGEYCLGEEKVKKFVEAMIDALKKQIRDWHKFDAADPKTWPRQELRYIIQLDDGYEDVYYWRDRIWSDGGEEIIVAWMELPDPFTKEGK